MKRILIFLSLLAFPVSLVSQSKISESPILFTSSFDGISWSADPVKLIVNGSNPSALVHNDKIYLYYINDTLSLITGNSGGLNFKYSNVKINRISSGTLKDPDVIYHNGKFYLVFLVSVGGKSSVRRAVSDDGIIFNEEMAILYEEPGIFKPDVYITGNDWNIILTQGGDLIKIFSHDGITFYRDSSFFAPSAMYSSTLKEADYQRIYYTGNYSINLLTYKDKKIKTEGEIFRDHNIFISEPSVIKTKDSSYFMFYKKILPNDFIDTCGCEKKPEITW